VSRIDDIFDEVMKSSMESKESSETKDKSYVVGSFIGIEIPIILLIVSLFSIVTDTYDPVPFGIALLGMGALVLLVINNLPTGARMALEMGDDFDSMAFYVMAGLFAIAILIAWTWSG
jgi:hypothetical protein